MAQQQQTVLRIQTGKPNQDINFTAGSTSLVSTGFTFIGSGTTTNPFTGTTTGATTNIDVTINNTGGIFAYSLSGHTSFVVIVNGQFYDEYTSSSVSQSITVNVGDFIQFIITNSGTTTVNALSFNPIPPIIFEFDFLDLYSDIPIKITKSFAELQDIGKKNSDLSIGLQLPGTKRNNRFFENYYNVNISTLFFNPTLRIPCSVLINDESYFDGYLKLNKISIMNTEVEYDVTLFSTVADLFGQIGNNLLKDLNYNDTQYYFNHTFSTDEVATWGDYIPWQGEKPPLYFYPVVHNGYNYDGEDVRLDTPASEATRLYTTTIPGAFTSAAAAYAAGVKRFRINSPQDGLFNNQLKPALNVKSILELMFKTYGYTIKSDFFNTPWFNMLYMYGYYSSNATKFSYRTLSPQVVPLDGIEVVLQFNTELTAQNFACSQFYNEFTTFITAFVVKKGTGIPCLCPDAFTVTLDIELIPCFGAPFTYPLPLSIAALSTGNTISFISDTFVDCGFGCPFVQEFQNFVGLNPLFNFVLESSFPLAYPPQLSNSTVVFNDGDFVDFGLVMDVDLKQIDLLSSIAKKFNLVLVPDKNNPNTIIIEPYTYYVGTGHIYDWTPKLSFDKGFTVEPALNYIESELIITDLDDGDYGNKTFKDRNNRIYGENKEYNPTDFKSQTKKIQTIFSPELLRQWDVPTTEPNGEVKLPLGINYAEASSPAASGDTEKVDWQYTGIKTKPKLFYWVGNFNPFLDTINEFFAYSGGVLTNVMYICDSDGSNPTSSTNLPVISHTMPVGNPDTNKINNDSISVLFNSEEPVDLGVAPFSVFTDNDAYNLFYSNRINNLYNKDTRFLSGFFNLTLPDIDNLQPNDIIKINEQYFTWNKITDYNLTNPELTKVELIQYNNTVLSYPIRYFQYFYCDNPDVIFNFETDMTNPLLNETNYGYSVFYDYNVGALLSGLTNNNVTSFTSSVRDNQSGLKYIPYTMREVTETQFNTSGIPRNLDTLYNALIATDGPLNVIGWPNSIDTTTPLGIIYNLFSGCTAFNSNASEYGIVTGSSTYHGVSITPTPTATLPQPSPTPTPEGGMRGSLMMSFDKEIDTEPIDFYQVVVNGNLRERTFDDVNDFYSTYLFTGDTVSVELFTNGLAFYDLSVIRRDYTTDDENGNNGIVDTFITAQQLDYGSSSSIITFTAETPTNTYNFEYRITIGSCFESGTGFGSFQGVFDVEIQDDYIYCGGSFTSYDGVSKNRFVELYSSGALDTGFTLNLPITETAINDFVFQTDGKIITRTINSLYRFNSNGTIDTTFFSGTTFPIIASGNFTDEIVTTQNDGKILIGGRFTGYTSNSQTFTKNALVRLNSDGTVDASFNNGLGFQQTAFIPFIVAIREIDVLPDGKILVGGSFNKYNGINVNGIVRLNPDSSIDTSFINTGSVSGDMVTEIITLPNGKILVAAAEPQTYFGINRGSIVRLNSDGGFDNTFVANVIGDIRSMVVNTDGSILLGLNNLGNIQVIKLNSNGTVNTSFIIGNVNAPLHDIELQFDGKIVVVGVFTTYNGISASGIIRLNADGSVNQCPPLPTPTPTPTLTATPSSTPLIPTPTPTSTPTVTPTSTPTTFGMLGRTTPDAASGSVACSTYLSSRGYVTQKSVSLLTISDVVYDSFPSVPTVGNNNWIAFKELGVGPAFAFQIDNSGVILDTFTCP